MKASFLFLLYGKENVHLLGVVALRSTGKLKQIFPGSKDAIALWIVNVQLYRFTR